MFNDTVTFYSYDADTENWKRTVIAGCQWSAETVKTVSTDGKLNISKVVNITIPVETAAMPEQYIDYRLYRTGPTSGRCSMASSWTLDSPSGLGRKGERVARSEERRVGKECRL